MLEATFRWRGLLLVPAFLLVACICATAQDSANQKKLERRFQQFLEYQKDKNYEGLYDMLSWEQRNAVTKELFLEAYRKSEGGDPESLTAFAIRGVALLQQSNFGLVEGCGEYTRKKKKRYLESKVEAVYENDGWYFRSLIGANIVPGLPIKKCGNEPTRGSFPFSLPETITVGDLSTVMKTKRTTYNLASEYTSRRIIGLPAQTELWQ